MFQLDVRSYIHPHRTISDSVQMLTMDDMMAMGRLAAGTFQLLSEHIQHNLRGILTSIKSYATPAYMSQVSIHASLKMSLGLDLCNPTFFLLNPPHV
eukprot:m.408758 g.408758  ORF g.408758 m.408758 type:complete len:97 (-) comp56510_c0_seq23:519-809(-)